jgi:alpha-mannosidase
VGRSWRVPKVHDGKPEQAATVEIVNPGKDITSARLTISQGHTTLKEITLDPIPKQAVSRQPIWIPSPYEDAVMELEIKIDTSGFGTMQRLKVPAYHSYFDSGSFAIHCTCHNDLGWLNTPAKTADFRSEKIILPALRLLEQYPDFRYSMESTVYLMEFLERHPERREDMYEVMRQGRFAWGASYVQCQEVHIGPEKLVRQFYYGRRWLRQNFPGVDSQTYYKTDPPSLSLQMPQVLRKAGIKYLIQGRMPFGYYRWEAPDGSVVFTYGLTATPLRDPLDPKGKEGWLKYAAERENYYAPRALPAEFLYDYWFDYFIPQPELPRYVQDQKAAMARFAEKWNDHYASDTARQIHPPRIQFTCLEEFFDEFTRHPLNITTLKGDWPLNWAYYDEPGHREGLLTGRLAHNRLLSAERIYTGLAVSEGFEDYPQKEFTDAWMTNCWPDHGWGGNLGLQTDAVFVASYEKSLQMADQLIAKAGAKLTALVQPSQNRIPLVVFNPLSWARSDVAQAAFTIPAAWQGLTVRDAEGADVPFEIIPSGGSEKPQQLVFIAEQVPSMGYRTLLPRTCWPGRGRNFARRQCA